MKTKVKIRGNDKQKIITIPNFMAKEKQVKLGQDVEVEMKRDRIIITIKKEV